MSSRPCCEIHSRISQACQHASENTDKIIVSIFSALKNKYLTISQNHPVLILEFQNIIQVDQMKYKQRVWLPKRTMARMATPA